MGITRWLRREKFQSQSEEDGLIRQPFVLKIGQETVLPEIGKDIPLVVRASDGFKGIFTFKAEKLVFVRLPNYRQLKNVVPKNKKMQGEGEGEDLGPLASFRFRFGLIVPATDDAPGIVGCDVIGVVETRTMSDGDNKLVLPVEYTDLFFALHKAGGREVLRLYGPGWHLDYNDANVVLDPRVERQLSTKGDLPR